MLLIVTDGGLHMYHRDDKPEIANPGCWAGFGGAVEDGETVEKRCTAPVFLVLAAAVTPAMPQCRR